MCANIHIKFMRHYEGITASKKFNAVNDITSSRASFRATSKAGPTPTLDEAEAFQQELPYLTGDATEEQMQAVMKYASWLDTFCRHCNQIRDWFWDYVDRRNQDIKEEKEKQKAADDKKKAKAKKKEGQDDWGTTSEDDLQPDQRPKKATHARKEKLKASAPAAEAGRTRSRTPEEKTELEVLLDENEEANEKRTHGKGRPDSRDTAPSGRQAAR